MLAKTEIVISAPDLRTLEFELVGTSPYVSNNFSEEARQQMVDNMLAGTQQGKKKVKTRAAKDFDKEFRGSMHLSTAGWIGIPASSFRKAMVSTCKLLAFKMTVAKLSLFVLPDGFDTVSGEPLVQIVGEPELYKAYVRLANGAPNIIARAMFREWSALLKVQFDGGQFSGTDVANLLHRVGAQCGIGAGRHDSTSSTGVGYGCFALKGGAN